jgi:CubicO group peptidase (beta-lactamase class C family)
MARAETAGPAVEVEPEEAGFDRERLARVDALLERYAAEGRVPDSAVVVSRDGKVAHTASAGEALLDAIWRIYSMTKPITSVAAMMLFEEGLLDLTDPVSKFLPSFADVRVYKHGPSMAPVTVPATEPMLVRHLLTHMSGLSYGFWYRDAVDAAYRANESELFVDHEDYDLAEACERWATLPLLFQPGAEWNYSVSTDVLARVVEVASGRSIDEFFAERIFAPLGMTDTGYAVPEAERPRLARFFESDPATGKAAPNTGFDHALAEQPRYRGGGHGLLSTLADYHRFASMLLGGGELDDARLLNWRTLELMSSNYLPDGRDIASYGRPLGQQTFAGCGFGLGFSVIVDPVAANTLESPGTISWGGAAGTNFWVDPAEDLIVVFAMQVRQAAVTISRELRHAVYQALVE